VVDETSVIDVLLLASGQLQSVSESALLNGENAALVGDEIIQFMNAEMLGMGKYRLTRLLRGRLGTNWAMLEHNIGERFVLLGAELGAIGISPANIGMTKPYKAVTFGQSLGEVAPRDFSFNAVSLKPYAPVHLSFSGELGADIMLQWVRCDRLYGAWRDYVDIGLSEVSELYDIEIYLGGVLKRTVQTSSPNFTYSSAMQTLDGAIASDILLAKIYQLSNIVGRGIGLEGQFVL
jgi:hypothetical protein